MDDKDKNHHSDAPDCMDEAIRLHEAALLHELKGDEVEANRLRELLQDALNGAQPNAPDDTQAA